MSLEWLNYILTALGIALTLAGLVLAIYGWYNLHRADRLVEEKVRVYLTEIEDKLNQRLISAQEAIQKITSAYALSAQGEHERAIELLESAVRIDPRAFNGYIALGYEYFSVGKTEEAIESFLEARRIFSDRFEPCMDLARVYAKMGNNDLALKHLREALELNPQVLTDIESDPLLKSLRQELIS